MKKLFIILLLIIFILGQLLYAIYLTSDEEMQEDLQNFIESKTGLIRESFETIKNFVMNSWMLFMEDDMLEMNSYNRSWKTSVSRFFVVLKIFFSRNFKTFAAVYKALSYPIKLLMNLNISAVKSTYKFVSFLYGILCCKLTFSFVSILKLIIKPFRLLPFPANKLIF